MKKSIFLMFCLVLCICVTACKKEESKVPDIEEFATQKDKDAAMEKLIGIDEKTFIEKWGEPEVIDGNSLWEVPLDGETKYVCARFENGELVTVRTSDILYLVVTEVNEGWMYCLADFYDYSYDFSHLTTCTMTDVFGNTITPEVGDMYMLEFDGMIMESYPAQLHTPYSFTNTGEVTDEILGDLESGMTDFYNMWE